jgi:AcrR family transcriptional regulator
LSHPKVDRRAGVPEGSTSYYFRTRTALLRAVAERLAELDLAELKSVTDAARADNGKASRLATVVMRSASEPGSTRTKARFELLLQANRDPVLAESFRHNIEIFTELHREIVERWQPTGVDADTSVIDDQTYVTMNFISGVMMSLAAGDRAVGSPEHLDRLLSQIIAGIAAGDDPAERG